MIIHKAKASSYSTVNTENVARYIHEYSNEISDLICNSIYGENCKRLQDCNKTQLNQIAAELETVKKRLEWIIEGRY